MIEYFKELQNEKNILVKNEKLSLFINDYFNIFKKDICKVTFFDLDKKNVEFFLKKKILDNLSLKSFSLNKKLFFISSIKFFNIFFFYIVLIYFKRRKKNTKVIKKKYLLDNLSSQSEIELYEELEKSELKDNYLFRVNKKNLENQSNRKYFKRYNNYDLKKKEILILLKILYLGTIYTIKYRFNFIYLFLSLVDEILFYKSLFSKFQFDYLFMHQHYMSSNVKNFYFKKNGGKKSCLIQKNILTLNNNNFFYNCDYFFSIGENVNLKPKFMHSRIEKNINIGSIFMHKNKKIIEENLTVKKEYDVICIGGNDLVPGGYNDICDNYNKDYLEHLNWLIKLKKDNPYLKIAFKHHKNNKNLYEENILKPNNIEIINQNLNSYELCLKSKLICSWCSTMIIEMRAVNSNSYFLDPYRRNDLFLHQIANRDVISITNYLTLNKIIKNIDNPPTSEINTNEKFCYDFRDVIKKMMRFCT